MFPAFRGDWTFALAALVTLAAIASPVKGQQPTRPPSVVAETDALAGQIVATQILRATRVEGGLVVHLGCTDGRLIAALRPNDRYTVQGLDTDPQRVAAARETIRSKGLYGPVSAIAFSGQRLPYVDNLVNLVVAEEPGEVTDEEIQRVLCPGGVAYVKRSGEWIKTVKPRSPRLDEWTHYLHDATGNPVGADEVVGPPEHLQWVGSPAWTRHHDHMSSFNAMVSAGGRVFYIIDEGPRAEIQLPPQWSLIARDAFNGTILWKRPIAHWQPHLWPAKSGPAQLPRRLVAVGNTVYVTLGLHAPVSALDAATGKTIREYAGTEGTEEILFVDGQLLALVPHGPVKRPWSTRDTYPTYADLAGEVNVWQWDGRPRTLLAMVADTGQVQWKARTPVAPLTLAADVRSVFFHDGQKVVCLDRETGHKRWESQPVARAAEIRSWFAPTLVVRDGVVVFAGGEKVERHHGGNDTMTALDAATGETLWTAEHPRSGYDSPEDVFVVDGLVWTAPTTNRRDTGLFTGRDLHTGEVKRSFASDCGDHMPHHRCHRAKATGHYILASRTGIEYVDLVAEHWNRNDWVRGACLYGIVPANGLTYAPPQSCACYVLAKLNGLNALAPARKAQSRNPKANEPRLEHGPAFASPGPRPSSPAPSSQDWPTYRHDAARSGSTQAAVDARLNRTWEANLGGRLSSPVVAGDIVLVASIDQHTVHALDFDTGRPRWQFTAGGRVDSPPTVWQGRVLFGSADGWVYCLRAEDGVLVWRFRAAPSDLRLSAFEQIESVWPVHGSVLVHDGVVHCVAGRSMFLDGGMRYLRIDAQSGKLLSETRLDDRNPETGEPLDADVQWPNLPVALPDVLSCDGRRVYMRSQPFDLEGNRIEVKAPKLFTDQTGETAHLFALTGFLDDSWWHRTYWLYGKNALGGAGGWYLAAYRAPTGRIMAFDAERVYSFDRRAQYYPRTTAIEYHLFAASKEPEIAGEGKVAKDKLPASGIPARRGRPAPSRPVYDWSRQVPLLGRALVATRDTVFVAGPPDLADEEVTLTSLDTPETAQKLAAQAEALAGRRGGLLLAVDKQDARRLAAYRLPTIPVFDGMIAARGSLVLSTVDGRAMRLGAEGEPLEAAPEVEPAEIAAAPRPGGPAFTTSHPDFQHLFNVQITPCDLGYRVRTSSGEMGLAVRKLAEPVTKKATFKLRVVMIPNKSASAERAGKPQPGNAFLALGDEPEDEKLVKFGMRSAGQSGMIVQGPLMKGKITSKRAAMKVNEVIEMTVVVDLEAGKVSMTLLGETIEAPLDRRMESISYVGYAVNSVASEFSPIEITQP